MSSEAEREVLPLLFDKEPLSSIFELWKIEINPQVYQLTLSTLEMLSSLLLL